MSLSASAISAEFFIDSAATAALPEADNGSTNPTLTCPLPATSGCCGGRDGPCAWELNGLENWLRLCCTPAQAPSSGAPRIKPIAVRRVAPEGCDSGTGALGSNGATMLSLLLTDRNRPGRPPGK